MNRASVNRWMKARRRDRIKREGTLVERIDAALAERQRFVEILPRDNIEDCSRSVEWEAYREPIASPMHGRSPCYTMPDPVTAPVVFSRDGRRMVDLAKLIRGDS